MRKVIAIAWNDILIFLQSPMNAVFLVVMPMIFIFVMGSALGGGGSGPVTLRLDVIDEDGSAASQALIAELAQANPNVAVCPAANDESDRCGLGDVETLTAEAAYQRLDDETSFATLIIPAGYGAAVESGEPVELVFQSKADLTAPQVVIRTVQSVINRVGGVTVAARLSTEIAEERGLVDEASRGDYYAARYAEAETAWESEPIQVNLEATQPEETDTSSNSGFGQSTTGMASMFVMQTVLGLAAVMVEERQNRTLPRLIVMPITKAQLLGGKLLRSFALGIIQFTILVVFGSFFGVRFGDNIPAVIVVIVAYVLAMTAISLALATFARTSSQADGIALLGAMTLAPIGGAWWPLEIVPQWMQTVGHISPVAWCMDAFRSIMYQGGGLPEVAAPVLVLLGFAVVFFVIGIARFKYE